MKKLLVFSILLLSFNTISANEYNREYWKTIYQEIESEKYMSEEILYDIKPNVDLCNEGSLSQFAKDRALEAVNEIRKLHNLPEVQYSYNYDTQVQKASLIIEASGELSHQPNENYKCYSQDGYNGSSTSNLGGGYDLVDPADDIIGWIDDAYNSNIVSGVGHRRWALTPFLDYISYGQVNGNSSLKVFDFNNEVDINNYIDVDFVAFPYQKYPFFFLSDKKKHNAKKTPWSFSIVKDKSNSFNNDYEYFQNAEIKIIDKETMKELNVNTLYTNYENYGLPNLLSWFVDDWEYDKWYTVQINSVKLSNGLVKDYEYDVYIDYKYFIDLNRELESSDKINGLNISGKINNSDDDDSYEIELSGNTTFNGESTEYSNMAYYINVYDSNKILIHSSDESFSLNLVDDKYTIIISNRDDLTGTHYSSLNSYVISISTQQVERIDTIFPDDVKILANNKYKVLWFYIVNIKDEKNKWYIVNENQTVYRWMGSEWLAISNANWKKNSEPKHFNITLSADGRDVTFEDKLNNDYPNDVKVLANNKYEVKWVYIVDTKDEKNKWYIVNENQTVYRWMGKEWLSVSNTNSKENSEPKYFDVSLSSDGRNITFGALK